MTKRRCRDGAEEFAPGASGASRAPHAILLLVCSLCLWGSPLAAQRGDAPSAERKAARTKQQRVVKELLGFDRWRRLEAARFDFELSQRDLISNPPDDYAKLEELEDVFISSLLRLGQKRIQRSMRLMQRRDELRAKLRRSPELVRPRRGLDLSPGLRLGTTSSIGVKLRLRGLRSRLFSGASLRLRREVGGPSTSVKLAYRDGHASTYLVYETAHERRGESVELGLRYTF